MVVDATLNIVETTDLLTHKSVLSLSAAAPCWGQRGLAGLLQSDRKPTVTQITTE